MNFISTDVVKLKLGTNVYKKNGFNVRYQCYYCSIFEWEDKRGVQRALSGYSSSSLHTRGSLRLMSKRKFHKFDEKTSCAGLKWGFTNTSFVFYFFPCFVTRCAKKRMADILWFLFSNWIHMSNIDHLSFKLTQLNKPESGTMVENHLRLSFLLRAKWSGK